MNWSPTAETPRYAQNYQGTHCHPILVWLEACLFAQPHYRPHLFTPHLHLDHKHLTSLPSHRGKAPPVAKCLVMFQKQEVARKYLGHIITPDGLKPNPNHVAAVRASYYWRFIQKFTEIAQPLHQLTKKGVPFDWTAACLTAFDRASLSKPLSWHIQTSIRTSPWTTLVSHRALRTALERMCKVYC